VVVVAEQVIQVQVPQEQVQEQVDIELLSQVEKKYFFLQDQIQLQLEQVEQVHVQQRQHQGLQMLQMVQILLRVTLLLQVVVKVQVDHGVIQEQVDQELIQIVDQMVAMVDQVVVHLYFVFQAQQQEQLVKEIHQH
jgi:hypothetical protein